MGLEGQQSDTAATPKGGERPPCARGGRALRSEVTMDEGLEVAGEARSPLTFMRGGFLKCLESSEGRLRYFDLLGTRSWLSLCPILGENVRSGLVWASSCVKSFCPLARGWRKAG